MALFLRSERKAIKVRLFLGSIYVFLTVGAITMIYPFLLMLSGSLKGKLDAYDFNVVPKFLIDDDILFKRYVEQKYNEKIQDYQVANNEFVRIFKSITVPQDPDPILIENWVEFQNNTYISPENYHVGSMYYLPGAGNRITTKNTRKFRNYIREICNDDTETFRKYFDTPMLDWYFLDLSPERLLDKNYQIPKTKLSTEFYRFKKQLPFHDRIYLSIDGEYVRYLKSLEAYNSDITLFNEINNTAFDSFHDVLFERTVPKGRISKYWEDFVRSELNVHFIHLKKGNEYLFKEYLKQKFKNISSLNKRSGSNYNSFHEVNISKSPAHESYLSNEYINFIKSDRFCPVSSIIINSPEFIWRDFLKEKYYKISNYNSQFNQDYSSFSQIPMPVKQADKKYVYENRSELRWEYVIHNYKMVGEYLTLFGDGLKNTIIYCFFSILTALIVNPLAAYALSRYNLSNQYKILLFFIATMTFPPMVTMIPNYLLMKDIGFLNTFFALIIPGMANGYGIFLLKGFFDSLPRELYEAADIDAAGEVHKFWHIAMSLSKPILAVIALGAFNGAYSNFMFAVVLCPDQEMWTLMVWLVQMQYFSARGAVMASLVVSAVPTLIVFIFAQKIILRGIVLPVEK
tara:strand:- start:14483 stop:16369 length:1887 start_codon:yes stop_codon:yes gene_type:complete